MGLDFEWDRRKAEANVKKHSVSFEEAATGFGDPLSVTIEDPLHSDVEQRLVTLGSSFRGRLLVVVHADSDDTVRIISARLATHQERKNYEEGGETFA